MKNEKNIIFPIVTKILLEVAANTPNRIPLKNFKKSYYSLF